MLSLKLATKVFFFINDKNEDVNACIRENGFAICRFLIKDIKEELNECIDRYYLGEHFIKIKLSGINNRKKILLSIVNSGLLQEDALALVSDFIAAFEVSAIADATAEQQKKIEKKKRKKTENKWLKKHRKKSQKTKRKIKRGEGNDFIIPLSSCLNPVTPLHTASEIQYS